MRPVLRHREREPGRGARCGGVPAGRRARWDLGGRPAPASRGLRPKPATRPCTGMSHPTPPRPLWIPLKGLETWVQGPGETLLPNRVLASRGGGERHRAPFWSREPRIFSGVYYSCSLRFPASWLGSWIPSFLLFLFRMGIRDEYEHRVGRQMGRSGGSPVRTDGQEAVFRKARMAGWRLFASICEEDGRFGSG